jgi:chromosome partitioning protein
LGLDFIACDNLHATRLTIHMLAAIAEVEARRIGERTKAALAAYQARGGLLGGSLLQFRNLSAEARPEELVNSGGSRPGSRRVLGGLFPGEKRSTRIPTFSRGKTSRYSSQHHRTTEGHIVPVITALNQKGGVGKTSTCHHLAGTLALMGRRVLLVDNDPQASLSQGFWGPQATMALDPAATIAAVYAGDRPLPEQVIQPTGIPGIEILPSSQQATDYNVPRPYEAPWEMQACLREILGEVRDRYDLVLIDCPPNLHLCSWAALVASDHLIVPLQPEDYGAQGIIAVQDSVSLVRNGPNPDLLLLGFLITMIAARKTVHKLYEATLREMYEADVFATTIPEAVDFVEAIYQRKPVAQYKPRSAAAKAIRALADELFERLAARDAERREVARWASSTS